MWLHKNYTCNLEDGYLLGMMFAALNFIYAIPRDKLNIQAFPEMNLSLKWHINLTLNNKPETNMSQLKTGKYLSINNNIWGTKRKTHMEGSTASLVYFFLVFWKPAWLRIFLFIFSFRTETKILRPLLKLEVRFWFSLFHLKLFDLLDIN